MILSLKFQKEKIEISVSGEEGFYFVSVKVQSSVFNGFTQMSVPYLTMESASVADLKRLLNTFPRFQPGGYCATKTGKKQFTEADKLVSIGFKFARRSKCTYHCVFTLVPGQELPQTVAEPQSNPALEELILEPLSPEPISHTVTPEPQPILLDLQPQSQTDIELQQKEQPQSEQFINIPTISEQPYQQADQPVIDLTAFLVDNQ